MAFGTPLKKAKPIETSSREYDIWMLSITRYVNGIYEGTWQAEFDDEHKMRDYVETIYVLDRKWTRTLGQNEFWYAEKGKKTVHTHVVTLQKIRKSEKIVKTLEEEDMLF